MATTQLDLPPEPPPDTAQPATTSAPRGSGHRLGLPFDQRLLLSTLASFSCGSVLGYTTTARLAALQFRAENAHRLPTSQPGWYLYHKSKKYHKWKTGVPAALRSGAYLASWSAVFFVLEESLDVFRGTWRAGRTLAEMEGVDELDMRRVDQGVERSRDFWSSAVAGMVTGGLWSAWNHFPMVTAARTIRVGLAAGLVYGLGQDALTWARGRVGDSGGEESWVYRGAKNRRRSQDEDAQGAE